jgi:hypothetical protein
LDKEREQLEANLVRILWFYISSYGFLSLSAIQEAPRVYFLMGAQKTASHFTENAENLAPQCPAIYAL